jgi:hypothetical protein
MISTKLKAFEERIDGIVLIREYIQALEPFITRCKIVGGKFLYASKGVY